MREQQLRLLNTQEDCFWDTVGDWLNETEEIVVQRSNSRISRQFVITSVESAHKLIRQSRVGDWIDLIRGRPFPIRGSVDQAFISSVEEELASDANFVVLKPTYYPQPLGNYLGSGNSCRVVARVLENYLGHYVWIGELIWVPAFDDATNEDVEKYVWARVEIPHIRPWWRLW